MTSIRINFPEGTKASDVSPINKAIAEVAGRLGLALDSNGRVDNHGIEFNLVRRYVIPSVGNALARIADLDEPRGNVVSLMSRRPMKPNPRSPMPPQAA